MKIAINHYGRFECEPLGLFLNRDDSFIVTPKIEKSKQFQTGLARKKFRFVEVTDLTVVQKAVNVTDVIVETFRKKLTADPEPEDPVPEDPKPDAEEEVPPANDEAEKSEEPPAEDKKPDDGDESEKDEQDPVLPFTEAAGGIAKAKVAIEKETDIEKLKFALEHDSRVTLKPVLEAKIKELES